MTLVEKHYNQALDRMTGRQRVERTLSLFSAIREMLRLQIVRESAGLSEREISIKIAQTLYLSDKGALALIAKARAS